MSETDCHGSDLLEELPWDSQHFGFRVAQINSADVDDAGLEEVLQRARRTSVGLVYWATAAGRGVPERLLRDYTGVLVDWKTTLAADLPLGPSGTAPFRVEDWTIAEYPRQPATRRLLELGIAAGAHSRFYRDSRIPREKAAGLFELWTQACAQRTAADVVLTATRGRADSDPAGMVTLSVKEEVGQIGLIAVHQSARGKRIGDALLREAHRQMVQRGAKRTTVVTQRANVAACRLYERRGYSVQRVRQFFHFWPRETAAT